MRLGGISRLISGDRSEQVAVYTTGFDSVEAISLFATVKGRFDEL